MMNDRWETIALEAQICENALQILGTGAPKSKFWSSPDQLLLAGTIENGRPDADLRQSGIFEVFII